ncbi:MAG TPA: DUF5700 domain-containing putative Zn-dependent protease [Xanthomonadales bacterium]|nr:DUF5700 domain-containing putative Zn-dependent protease [Xanthomonadales bacterium]
MRTILLGQIMILALISPMTAFAQSVDISVDSSLADYIVEIACSDSEVDEDFLRNSQLLRAQIKHHNGNSDRHTMDAFIAAASAAARCEVLEPDLFRFRYVVEDTDTIAAAVAFFKSHEKELAAFVAAKTAPYFPADKEYTGEIAIVAASWSCGGFSMDGAFFVDVPCVADSIEDEFEAIKILSAHETYHALQYEFFTPFSEDMDAVRTSDAAHAYLFLNLLLEGTAEYIADSRDVPGEGRLASVFRRFAAKGYRQMEANFRWLDYSASILSANDSTNLRMRDVYAFGFSGSNDQAFYYVGAEIARGIEAEFGRQSLVCIMGLSPEQFVLAYHAAELQDEESGFYDIGPSVLKAARRLGENNDSYNSCFENVTR